MTCRHYVICSTEREDKVVDQWRTRLHACVKAKAGHHFEHLLYTSADSHRDLTGFLEPLTDFRGRLQKRFCG